jgi:hypothetical protein
LFQTEGAVDMEMPGDVALRNGTARGLHGALLPTLTGLAVSDGFGGVAEEAFLAIVAVPSCRVVPALEAHPAAPAPRKQVQLLIEAASPRVQVTLACCVQEKRQRRVTYLDRLCGA